MASEMEEQTRGAPAEPFAPSPSSAPFVSLGYREVAADLLYVRMIGYFNGDDSTGHGVADLAEAIVALDPRFHRVYDHGSNAMTLAKLGVTQSVYLRAIALLEHGMREFPDDWRLPYVAGQIYTQDLETDNPVLERAWDEKGVLLIESAIRKPGAPARLATWTAMMRTKLGEHERAVAGLREMLLVTTDAEARKRLIDALSDLEKKDPPNLPSEVFVERYKLERRWKAERPLIPPTMYILLGAPQRPGFDMYDLATGGRELFVGDDDTALEPLE